MDYKPCVVIPVYNHPQVHILVNKLLSYQLPCILVDDGSDEPLHIDAELITVLRHEKNLGKGSAVMAGFRQAAKMGYTHALQIDADGQHNADDIPKFLSCAKENPNAMIMGCPEYDESVPKLRLYARYLTHVWVWINTLSFDIKDSMCGFRVYPLLPVMCLDQEIKLGSRMDFDSEIAVRLHWMGIQMINLPTRVIYPKHNSSHFRLFKDNVLISLMHAKLFFGMLWKKRPQKHWAKIQETTFVTGMQFLLWVYKTCGRIPFQFMLYPVIGFYYVTNASARTASKNYLTRINAKNSFKHFMAFGESILDKLLLWGNLFKLNTIKSYGEDIFSPPRGGLLICSHLGNLELCRVMAKQCPGLKLTVLMHTKHAKAFNDILAKINPSSQLNIIQVTEITPATAIDLAEKINQGEFVVIAGDRIPVTPNARVVSVPFLGKNAPFPIGPYMLAHLLQCPVYLMFSVHTELYFEPFRDIIQLPRKNRDKLLTELATDYAARLEVYCRKAPLQWFNFYDFWNTHAHYSV